MAAITTTFVRLIDNNEIAQLGTVALSFNIGQAGASAYQSYLATTTDEPKLTQAQWVASLKGDKGEQGIQGEQGLQGVQGIQGVAGQSAYEASVAGGWVGTEAAFYTALASLGDYYTKSEIDNNFRNETQDTIGDLIELTELETVTDNTKIAASDSAFLKWFSGATLKTFLSLTYAKIVDYFSKTESDRRFVNQNGGTIYHITRWFTPTSNLTIAANGLSATITSGQFTSAMTGAKLKLTGGINEPIITYVSTNQINLSFAVDSAFWGRNDIAVADWGVYSRAMYTVGGAVPASYILTTKGVIMITTEYDELNVAAGIFGPYRGGKWKLDGTMGLGLRSSGLIKWKR